MKFRSFLFALALPPIYLFTHGRILGGIFSIIFWLLAWILLISIIGAMFSPFAYLISFMPAVFALRRVQLEEAAEVMAQKMVTAMRPSQS